MKNRKSFLKGALCGAYVISGRTRVLWIKSE